MRINDIFKKVITRLRNEGKIATPDLYAEVFCQEAKRAGIVLEDCNQINKFLPSMDKKLQKEISDSRVDSLQKLVRFLIGKLNRLQPSQATLKLESSQKLLKRVLKVAQLLHNKEVIQLANNTLDALEKDVPLQQFEVISNAWLNFLTTYDDTFLQKLKPLTTLNKDDLRESIDGISLPEKAKASLSSEELDAIMRLIVASLVPSIAPSVNDKLAHLSDTLKNDPTLLTSKSIESEIKEAIMLRIALDKKALKEMVKSIDTIVDKLSVQLIDLIEKSDSSNVELKVIKKELENYDEAKDIDFKTAHTKLYNVAIILEEKTEVLSRDLKSHNDKIVTMKERISELEKELAKAQETSKMDFLTKLYNKRALEEFFALKESEFTRYNRNYSIVMFDIDFFKKVNDNYGHEAGDKILQGFAKILKKLCRTVDVVGRFGGEEFVAILSETDLKGGVIFAKKVNQLVEKTRFMYKNQHIPLTVSAGVAERVQFNSQQETMNSADQRLYDAKNSGRNRVEPSL